jgi:hypothetical protein
MISEVLDCKVSESHHAILANSVDPYHAVFGVHFVATSNSQSSFSPTSSATRFMVATWETLLMCMIRLPELGCRLLAASNSTATTHRIDRPDGCGRGRRPATPGDRRRSSWRFMPTAELAEWFGRHPSLLRNHEVSSGGLVDAIRHSLAIYSASRKASSRSFGRKRVS